MTTPEKKSPTEPLDLQRKMRETISGKRPLDRLYPYFVPDYELPFTHIGTEKQLFVDNFMLDHLDGAERVFPEPTRPERPMLEVGDLPWEVAEYANPIVSGAIYDEADGKFKLWYTISTEGNTFNLDQVLCYAESEDCLHWRKPLSELCIPFGEHKATNIVLRDCSADSVVLNHDQSDPDHKFLLLHCPYGRAKEEGKLIVSSVAASADGLRWKVISEDTQYRHQHKNSIVWDESIQRWVGYSQHSHHWHHGPRARQVGRQESEDFINWSPKEVVLSGDWDPSLPPNMEFGGMSVRKIGGLYIGIVAEYPCEPLWCARSDGANWRDEVRPRLGLYSSRDGKRWLCAGKSPWVNNRGPGSPDYGYVDGPIGGQMVHKGKTHIAYLAGPHKQWVTGRADNPTLVPDEAKEASAARLELLKSLGVDPGWPSKGPERRSVGVLILREDGWAEIKPTYECGKVYTKQFVFEGNVLKVNADCAYGCVKVEMLDPHFHPYEGFSREDCGPLHGPDSDTAWRAVMWRGNSDVSKLWNKPCRILFDLHETSLYGFQFVWENATADERG
ncbi:MAG: hypothetical protein Q7T82_10355 [Armatimonadota bacterium]|nr:hypothetical protein [Armatimonadota bacterium]